LVYKVCLFINHACLFIIRQHDGVPRQPVRNSDGGGVSWKKDIGYFECTPDMVSALERKTIGKKIKQVPVIRYKSES